MITTAVGHVLSPLAAGQRQGGNNLNAVAPSLGSMMGSPLLTEL